MIKQKRDRKVNKRLILMLILFILIIPIIHSVSEIKINKAEHLDENRTFISDIYDEVYQLDDIWSEPVSNGHYVRVTFRILLDNTRDITIYPRVVEGEPRIEVYEVDGSEIIADFTDLIDNEYNKVYLTNLQGEQDVFDLRVVGGSVEFDHIIDPTEIFFEDCTTMSDKWTQSTWYSTSGECDTENPGIQEDETLQAEDFSLVGATDVNISFYWRTVGHDVAGSEYIAMSISNDSGATWYQIWNHSATGTDESASGVENITLQDKVTFTAAMALKLTCGGGNKENCYFDNINVTSYEAVDNTPPEVNLIGPVDYQNFSSGADINFNCSMLDTGDGLKNSTLYGNWSGAWHANETQPVTGASVLNSTNFTKTIPDGNYIWNYYVCDQNHNCQFNSTNWTFTIDTIYPTIEIVYPSNNTNTTNNQIDVNYTVSDLNLQACKWSNDSGVTNKSLTCGDNITGETWDEGSNTVIIWANDSAGNENSSSVAFTVDTIPPNIEIVYPPNNTNTTNNQINVNYTVSDDDGVFCWYSNDTYSSNETLSNCDNITGVTWSEGQHNVTVWANDSSGNENSSSVTFIVDSIYPLIDFGDGTEDDYANVTVDWIYVNVTVNETNERNTTFLLWNSTAEVNKTIYTDKTRIINWTDLPDETYTYNVTVCDIVAQCNATDTYTITIDTTPPDINFTNPTTQTGNYSQNYILANVTATDGTLDTIIIYLYNTTDLVNSSTSSTSPYNINFSNLPDETYYLNATANDTVGNENQTETRTITLDTSAPVVDLNSPQNGSSLTSLTVYFVANYTNENLKNTTLWIWNSTLDVINNTENRTITGSSNFTNISIVLPYDDTFYWNYYTCDDASNCAWNLTNWSVTIDSIAPAIEIVYPPNNTNTTNKNIDLNYTISDTNTPECWWSNDSGANNKTLTCGTNITGQTWDEGSNTVIVYANDSAGNENSSSVTFTVDTIPPYFTNGTPSAQTITYGTALNYDINATDSGVGLDSFTVNNTGFKIDQTSGLLENNTVLGVDEYYLNITINDTVNNLNSTVMLFNITKATGQTSLIFDEISPQDYGTTINASCSVISGEGNIVLYRNGDDVTAAENGQDIILGVTTHNYECNLTATQNYTSSTNQSIFTIDQATGQINGTINRTQGNFTVVNGTANQNIYINATNITGYGTGKIYVNGTLYNSGTLPLYNVTNLSIGFYNITFEYDGNTNYTSDSDVWWVNIIVITDAEYPIFSNYNETPANDSAYVSGQIYRFNATIISTNGTVGLEFDGSNYTATNLTADMFNVTIGDLAAATYSYYWWAYGNGTESNYNTSLVRYYTVAKATPSLTFLVNSGTSNLSLTYPQQVNISATSDYGTVGLDKDGEDFLSNNALNVTLGAGSYIFRANVTGNQNYSDVGYSYYNITINQATGEINGTINRTQGNFTAVNGTANQNIYINATNITGYGTGKIYVNGTLYNSGTLPLYNVTNLSIGFYNITFEYDGNTNYTSDSDVWWVNITVVVDIEYPIFTSPTETPSEPTNYSFGQAYEFNITVDNTNGTVSLDFNGTNYTASNYTTSPEIFNVTFPDLSAGNYTYYWWARGNGTSHWFNNSITYSYNISKAVPEGNLTNDTALTRDYDGTETTIGLEKANLGDGDVTYKIYRDNADKETSDSIGAAGTYNYVLNTTGGQNYTVNASMDSFTLTINKVASSINLTLNNSEKNITITQGDSIDLNCSTITGDSEAYLLLYRGGSLINNDTSPIGNTTIFNTAQVENITCIYSNSQNYSSSSETWWVNVTEAIDNEYPIFINYWDNNGSLKGSGTGLFNVTIDSTNGTVLLEINNTNITATNLTANVYNASHNFDASGVYAYRWHSWGNGTFTNYNKSVERSYTVNESDTTPPEVNLITPTDGQNLSSQTVEFNCSMIDTGDGLKNSTLYGNWTGSWQANETQLVSGASVLNSTNFTKTISDGTYKWNCYVCDQLHNCAFNSTNWTFTMDTINPSLSITAPPNNTNTTNVNLDVNYTVFDLNIQACKWSNDSGQYNQSISCGDNITGQTWDQGSNTIFIWANDSFGNENRTSVTFTVDTIPPSLSIVYPPNNTNTTNNQIDVNYTVSDGDLQACWYSNDTYSENSTLSNCDNITIMWSEGQHNVTVWANDSSGNENKSSITFTIDTTPPYFTHTIDNFELNVGDAFNYDVNATDDGVGLQAYAVNNTNFEVNSTGWIKNATTLGAALYYINISINDTLGNLNSSVFYVNVTVPLDEIPPEVNLIEPTDGQNLSSQTVEFNCSMIDTGDGLKNSTLYGNWSGGWHANETQLVSGTSILNSTNFTVIIADGTYIWNCYVCDNAAAGNCAFNNTNWTFTIDTTAPYFTNWTDQTLPETNSLSYDINADDDGVGLDSFAINWTSTFSINSGTGVLANTSGLSVGEYYINVSINDTLGNLNSSILLVNVTAVDNTNPSISIVYPQNTSYNVNVSELNYTASDETALDSCWYSLNNGETNSSIQTCGTNWTGLTSTEDSNTWTVYVNDTSGNENSSSVTFTVDTTLLTLTILSPGNKTYFTNESLLLNYSVSGEQAVWYNLNGTNTTITSSIYFNTSQGSHVLYLFANNSGGNLTTKNVSFVANSTIFTIIYNEYKGDHKGESTNFDILAYEDIQSLSDIILENTQTGKILFTEDINLTNDEDSTDNVLDLDSHTNISFNRIEVNSTALPNFNKSARLYFYNLTYSDAQPLKDGVVCPSSICTEVSYSSGEFIYDVTEFSVYSSKETPSVSTPPPGRGGGKRIIKPECEKDSDCNKDYVCYKNKCVKLFDIKILDIDLPTNLKPFFNFTYFVKGMAEIKGDVIIKFWLEKDGKIMTSGHDTIYLGSFEEKTERTKLFLPSSIDAGIYDFYIQVEYESYSADSHREIEIVEPLEIPEPQIEKVFPIKSQIIFITFLILLIFSIIICTMSIFKRYYKGKFSEKLLSAETIKPTKSVIGLKVYTSDGNKIGRLEDVRLGDDEIYGWFIRLNRKYYKKMRVRAILIRNKHINAIGNILILDGDASESVENFKGNFKKKISRERFLSAETIKPTKSVIGLKVYTSDGNKIGRLEDVRLGDDEIYGWFIRLNRKYYKKMRVRAILIRNKHINAIGNILILDGDASEHIENFEENIENNMNSLTNEGKYIDLRPDKETEYYKL